MDAARRIFPPSHWTGALDEGYKFSDPVPMAVSVIWVMLFVDRKDSRRVTLQGDLCQAISK